MKRKYIIPFFIIFISAIIGCSNKIISQNSPHEYLKKEFGINNINFRKIEKNRDIIRELKLSVKDSLTKKKASSILDSFFVDSYSEDKLLTILEMNRVFKGADLKILDDKEIDSSKALIINDIKTLEELKKKLKAKMKTNTKIDSTKND